MEGVTLKTHDWRTNTYVPGVQVRHVSNDLPQLVARLVLNVLCGMAGLVADWATGAAFPRPKESLAERVLTVVVSCKKVRAGAR